MMEKRKGIEKENKSKTKLKKYQEREIDKTGQNLPEGS